MAIRGTRDNDDLTGTTGNDVFLMNQNGDDTVQAGDGDDIIKMGGALTAADKIDGGTGDDKVILKGDYSAGLTFAADTMVNVERLQLFAGHDYNLTLNDGNVAAGERLIVNGAALGSSNHLTLDGSAELDGRFLIYGGAGDDTVAGGAKADVFHLETGGKDVAHGGGGNDVFLMGAAFTAIDVIDGGTGNDTLVLNGDYSSNFTFDATTISNIDTVVLGSGHSYSLITDDATVASGATLMVDASALDTTTNLVFDGSAETDGNFDIRGGASDDIVAGGSGNDVFEGYLGKDRFISGDGQDTFLYRADPANGIDSCAAMSTSVSQSDVILDFNADSDKFDFDIPGVTYRGSWTIVIAGLSQFEREANESHGAGTANSAWIVHVESDDDALDGHAFVLVDIDGDGFFHQGSDIVIDITGYSGTFDHGDFI